MPARRLYDGRFDRMIVGLEQRWTAADATVVWKLERSARRKCFLSSPKAVMHWQVATVCASLREHKSIHDEQLTFHGQYGHELPNSDLRVRVNNVRAFLVLQLQHVHSGMISNGARVRLLRAFGARAG